MFKVGDNAKIVTYGSGINDDKHPVGRTGVVTKLDGALIMVMVDQVNWACYASELELV